MEPKIQVSYYRVLNRFSKVFTLPSQLISKRHLHRPAFRKVLFRLAVDLNAKACTGQLHNCRCPSQLCKMRRCFHLCHCSLPNANSKFDSLTFPILPIHAHANRNPFTRRKETCGATSTAITNICYTFAKRILIQNFSIKELLHGRECQLFVANKQE